MKRFWNVTTTLGSRYPNRGGSPYPNYPRFSVSEFFVFLFGYRDPLPVSVSEQGSISCQKQKVNTWFCWSAYGELKNLCRTSLTSLEAEKKPFYCFWQLFDPRGLGIRTRGSRYPKRRGLDIRTARIKFVRIANSDTETPVYTGVSF